MALNFFSTQNAQHDLELIIVDQIRYLINPTELDLEGKTAFFWAATAALTMVWAYFRLPEVKVSI